MADLFWEYGVKDTILNMLVYTDAPTFSLAKAWAGANSVRRYEVVARPTGEWRAVSGPQKPFEDQSDLHRKLAEASNIIDELTRKSYRLALSLTRLTNMSADLSSIIERIERYCGALECGSVGVWVSAAADDYRAAIDELRQLNAPEWNAAHRHKRRQPLPDPLYDTEQAMSRGWR